LGFRLGCLGDPILVVLLKFDAQIERKKEKKKIEFFFGMIFFFEMNFL